MPERESVVHEEVTKWAPWVAVLLWGSALVGALVTMRALSRSSEAGVPWATIAGLSTLIFLPFAIQILFGRLRVKLTRTALHLTFGYTPFIKRTVMLADVVSMKSVRYSPLREFGGWGIRTALRGRKRAWTQRGNRALVLTFSDGMRLYVGSADPERLAARVRMVADVPNAPEREDE